MPFLQRSQRFQLVAPGSFFWAAGIEDTFITAPWPATGRTLDEYELTGHYERWHADLGLLGKLGVGAARYGLPWHRLQPEPDRWDWDFAERAIDRLLELGIEPIIDLVHYGLPPWMKDAYLDPDFPDRMTEYAVRVAQRFRGRVFAYTPLNEPRITAWYCGRLGWWPPHRKGWRGFVAVLLAAARGIVQTCHALASVDPEILIAHVDATDLYRAPEPDLISAAEERQEIVFLALDLISGRVDGAHRLTPWLRRHGADDADFSWFQQRPVALELIGLNLYPMFTLKEARRVRGGGVRWTMRYADAGMVQELAKLYWERYHAPVFIAETASVGSVARRARWLEDSVQAVRHGRERGVPIVGYTWWPLFALVTWAYRQGRHPPEYYLKQMGLWNLDAKLERVSTPLVEQFQRLTAGGSAAAGLCARPIEKPVEAEALT